MSTSIVFPNSKNQNAGAYLTTVSPVRNILIVTNGTMIPWASHSQNYVLDPMKYRCLTAAKYYVNARGEANSINFTRDLAKLWGMDKDRSKFIAFNAPPTTNAIKRISANDTKEARTRAVGIIKSEISQFKEDHLYLFGHSHGGNVMIQVANEMKGYNITLVVMETPGLTDPDYHPDEGAKIFSSINESDKVQSPIAAIDLDKPIVVKLYAGSQDPGQFEMGISLKRSGPSSHYLREKGLRNSSEPASRKKRMNFILARTGRMKRPINK